MKNFDFLWRIDIVNGMDAQFQISPEFKTVALFTGAAIFAWFLSPVIQRTDLGPVISIFGEVIPIITSLGVLFVGLKGYGRMLGIEKLWGLACLLLATMIIAGAMGDIIRFWSRSYGRGDFIGW